MKRAVTIIRVSEEDQLKGYGPDVQGSELDAYLNEAGMVEVSRRVIQEESTTWNRPQFEAVLNELVSMRQRGDLEAVVFSRRNRLARYGSAGAYYVGLLDREGLEVHFARERRKYEPRNPDSFEWVMRGLSQAQADADEIRVNTSEGRRSRAEKDHRMPSGGRKWAYDYHRYRKSWGLAADPNSGRYTVNNERAGWVKCWADWILVDGMSVNKLSRMMSETYGITVDRSSVVDILSDPTLVGKVYAYRTKTIVKPTGKRKRVNVPMEEWVKVYEDDGLRILTDEQFYALRDKFKLNRENSPRHTKYWYPPLRSLIFCSCGLRMVGIYRNGKPYYRCVRCRAWVKAVPLWEQIRAGIGERLLAPERLIPAIESQIESGQSLNRLEEKIKLIFDKLDTLEEADQKALRLHLYLPHYPVEKLDTEIRHIASQRQQLEHEKSVLERQSADLKQAMIDGDGLRRFCAIAARNLDSLDEGRWRILLETMKLSVLVDGDSINVKVAVPVVKDNNGIIVMGTLQRQFKYLKCPLPSCSNLADDAQRLGVKVNMVMEATEETMLGGFRDGYMHIYS